MNIIEAAIGFRINHKVVVELYLGITLLWELVRSCFGKGCWYEGKPWVEGDAWKEL